MSTDAHPAGRLPSAFTTPGTSSFVEFLGGYAPQLLPASRAVEAGAPGTVPNAPHGTTIVALVFDGGVVLAGDRRATMGSMIASRHIEKVFPADEYSAVGIAGTAGLAVELVRLAQTFLASDGQIDKFARFREVFEDERVYDTVFSPKRLEGRSVRVRGFIEERGGPWIEAALPQQIEIVEDR